MKYFKLIALPAPKVFTNLKAGKLSGLLSSFGAEKKLSFEGKVNYICNNASKIGKIDLDYLLQNVSKEKKDAELLNLFKGIENPFEATRYHSLVIEKSSLPDCLEVTAWTENENHEMDEIMGVRHKELDVQGVQFHPESILTEYGHQMLKNFLDHK